MSRRKQAKPQSLSVRQPDAKNCDMGDKEQKDLEEGENPMNTEQETHGRTDKATDCAEKGQSPAVCDNAEISMESDSPPTGSAYKCETCACAFQDLQQFMDHRNSGCQNSNGNDDRSWEGKRRSASGPEASPCVSDHQVSGSPVAMVNQYNNGCLSPVGLQREVGHLPSSDGVDSKHPYGCDFCHLAFQRQSHLRKHEQIHSDRLPFSCIRCNRLFRSKKSRDRHARTHFEDKYLCKKKYACQKCDESFIRAEHYFTHLKKAHPSTVSGAYPCVVCNCSYNKPADLISHLKIHKENGDALTEPGMEEEGIATALGRETGNAGTRDNDASKPGVSSKSSTQTKPEMPCKYCDKIFMGREALEFHVQQMHPESCMSKCPICFIQLRNATELFNHIRWHSQLSYDKSLASMEKAGDLQKMDTGDNDGVKRECRTCGKTGFLSEVTLQLHVREFHSTTKATCFMCNKELISQDEMVSHIQQEHPSQYFSMVNRLQSELPAPSALTSHPCDYCPMNFSDRESLRIHQENVHKKMGISAKSASENTVLCAQCNAAFPNIYALANHVQTCHGYPVPTYSPYANLNRHHSNENLEGSSPAGSVTPPPTRKCGLHVISPNGLRVHTPKNSNYEHFPHSNSNQESTHSLVCSDCDLEFSDMGLLQSHKQTHLLNNDNHGNMELLWRCDLCSAGFLDMVSYTQHCSSVHLGETSGTKGVSDGSLYKCPYCSDCFDTEENLENHVTMHFLTVKREYGCTSCMKSFGKPDELQKHLVDIHAHHLYRCSLCKEIFDSKVDIQVHFAVKHSDECDIYKCNKCTAIFRSEMEWQLHVKVQHLGVARPYRCLICQTTFSNDNELQTHLATHKKQFTCHLCQEAFHVEFLLDKHMQETHADSASFITGSTNCADREKEQCSSADLPSEANELLSPDSVQSNASPRNSTLRAALQSSSADTELLSVASPALAAPQSASPKTPNKTPTFIRCDICGTKTTSEDALTKHKVRNHNVGGKMEVAEGLSADKNGLDYVAVSPLRSPGQWAEVAMMDRPLPISTSPSKVLKQLGMEKLSQLCFYCNVTFKTKGELEKHMKTHAVPSIQKCNICDQVFPTAAVLAEHKLTHCKVIRGDVCVVCKLIMKNEDHFYLHSQEHGIQGSGMSCIVCRQTLSSVLELQLHGRAHFSSRIITYTCCVCVKIFETKDKLISKVNASGKEYFVCKPCFNGGVSAFNCTECSLRFEDQLELESHMRTHKKTFQCIKCQDSFDTEYEIQIHVASHMLAEGNQHWCRICNQCFESPAKLQCHLIDHTFNGSELKCYVCDAVFGTTGEIQLHVLEHGLTARMYSCGQCNQSFFFKAEMLNHLYAVHGSKPTESTYSCPECSKVFSNVMNLNNHRKLHETLKDTTLKCTRCPLTFHSFNEVQQHFASVHSPQECERTLDSAVNTYDCITCGKSCRNHSALIEHMKSHDKEKDSPLTAASQSSRYSCAKCNKHYNSFHAYDAHIKNHTEEEFTCPTCHKSFSRRESMRSHMKCHTGIKPFRCSQCSQTFAHKSQLKTHEESQHKQTACDVCDKNFNTPKDLWRHQVIMHNMKTGHTCHICNSTYSDATDLELHMSRVHGLEKVSWSVKDKSGHRCIICNSPYKYLKDLEFHVQQIHGYNTNVQPEINGNCNSNELDTSIKFKTEQNIDPNTDTIQTEESSDVILLRGEENTDCEMEIQNEDQCRNDRMDSSNAFAETVCL